MQAKLVRQTEELQRQVKSLGLFSLLNRSLLLLNRSLLTCVHASTPTAGARPTTSAGRQFFSKCTLYRDFL